MEGASNFGPWKLMLHNLLGMAELWYLVEKVVALPTDSKDLAEHNKVAVTME